MCVVLRCSHGDYTVLQAISLFPWYQFRAHLSLGLSKLKNNIQIDGWPWDFLCSCAVEGGKIVKF